MIKKWLVIILILMISGLASLTPNVSSEPTDIKAATIVVSAYDSLDKYEADYVCDGTNDRVTWQQAIDYCYTNGGGNVYFKAGGYHISIGQITLRSGVDLIGTSSSNVYLEESYDYFRLFGGEKLSLIDDSNNWTMVSGEATFFDEDSLVKEVGNGSLGVAVASGGEAKREFASQDWSAYEYVAVWIRSPNSDDVVNLRIYDNQGNYSEWTQKWRRAGYQELLVPRSESDYSSGVVDWSDIVAVGVADLDLGTYYFDSVRVFPGNVRISNINFIGEEVASGGGTTVLLLHYACNVIIDNCSFIRISDEPIESHHSRMLTIDKCYFNGNETAQGYGTGGIVEVNCGERIVSITNCVSDSPSWAGGFDLGGDDITFTNNQIYGARWGIQLRGSMPTYGSGWGSGVIVSNNIIRNTEKAIIIFGGAEDFIISSNVIADSDIGIRIGVGTSGELIINNLFTLVGTNIQDER